MLQLQELLKKLGWTRYESSAYCVIVENGSLKANDLAIKSDIPLSRIYGVIAVLVNKGWLKKIGGRPAVYDAQNPRLVLNSEIEKLQEKKDESLKDAEQVWELRTSMTGNINDKSWTVYGMHGIILELRTLFQSVKKSLMIAESSLDWFAGSDRNRLVELSKDQIKVAIISTDVYVDVLKRLTDLGITSYVSKPHSFSFYICDEETILMKLNNPDSGIIIKDTNLAKMFIDKFVELRKNSKKVRVEEIAS